MIQYKKDDGEWWNKRFRCLGFGLTDQSLFSTYIKIYSLIIYPKNNCGGREIIIYRRARETRMEGARIPFLQLFSSSYLLFLSSYSYFLFLTLRSNIECDCVESVRYAYHPAKSMAVTTNGRSCNIRHLLASFLALTLPVSPFYFCVIS